MVGAFVAENGKDGAFLKSLVYSQSAFKHLMVICLVFVTFFFNLGGRVD